MKIEPGASFYKQEGIRCGLCAWLIRRKHLSAIRGGRSFPFLCAQEDRSLSGLLWGLVRATNILRSTPVPRRLTPGAVRPSGWSESTQKTDPAFIQCRVRSGGMQEARVRIRPSRPHPRRGRDCLGLPERAGDSSGRALPHGRAQRPVRRYILPRGPAQRTRAVQTAARSRR
jgi:hypothetical protein